MDRPTYPLAPNGVFWTVQGEGALVGTPMCFVRFAGCSVGCAQCDTDYTVAERVDLDTLLARIDQTIPEVFHSCRPWVWLTGGEPTDHDLLPVVEAIQAAHYPVALCTAGTRDPEWPVQWRSVSPHRYQEGLHGHEVKLVPGLGDLTWDDVERGHWGNFAYRFIQPLAHRPEEQRRAVDFVWSRPGWRLSMQTHKWLNIP